MTVNASQLRSNQPYIAIVVMTIISNSVGEEVDTAQSKFVFFLFLCLDDDDDHKQYSMMVDTVQGKCFYLLAANNIYKSRET